MGTPAAFRWNAIQRRFCAARTGRDIVLKPRQVGFTTLEEARDLWFALVHPGVSVAVVTIPDAKHLYTRKIVADLTYMLDQLGVDVGARWSGTQVAFANGSTVTVFDAGGSAKAADKTGRSGTYHRAHLTEAAFYPFAAATIAALLKTIPSVEQGGEFVEESTANGAGGVFHEHWQGAVAGLNGLRPHFFGWFLQVEYASGAGAGPASPADADEEELVAAARAAGIALDARQLAWWRAQRALNGTDKTAQEYPSDARTCFLLSGTSYFDGAALTRLEALAAPPLSVSDLPPDLAALATALNADDVALRVWVAPAPGAAYLAVADPAGGKRAGDWPTLLLFDRDTRAHVATYRQKVPPSEFARRGAQIATAFDTALFVIERNNHGGTVITVLVEQEHYPELWVDHRGEVGWLTTMANRLPAVDALVDSVTRAEFDTRDPLFAAEARTFVRRTDGAVAAAVGCHDDVILAAAIGWRVLHLPRPDRGPVPETPEPDATDPWGPRHGY